MKWFALNKGGSFRKWYGNNQHVINYENDGQTICNFIDNTPGARVKSNGRVINRDKYFRKGITWSSVSIGSFSMRFTPPGYVFSHTGPMCFAHTDFDLYTVLALGCSPILDHFLSFLSPDVHYSQGPLGKLPISIGAANSATELVKSCISLTQADWDAYERSWDFQSLPILTVSSAPTPTLESSYAAWIAKNRAAIAEMKRLEEENNRLFIDAYGLQDELSPEVSIEQITLTVNPAYRYGVKGVRDKGIGDSGAEATLTPIPYPLYPELEDRFRQDTMQELVSYAVGCMMGRYRLDRPGLIYAHSGNERFREIYEAAPDGDKRGHTSQPKSSPNPYPLSPIPFLPDADGIIPITDADWFDDDAAHRVAEFISVSWDKAHLEENLKFLADNLSPKKDESSRETIRRYLCDSFFKDHLQTYKNRPIYWCFTSGKQKAFQCLVYLHRYNEGTLARMRMEYVVPLAEQNGRPHRQARRRHPGRHHRRPGQAPAEGARQAHPATRRAAPLRRAAPPLRRPAHRPGPGRRRQGQLRQVRRPACGGEGGNR